MPDLTCRLLHHLLQCARRFGCANLPVIPSTIVGAQVGRPSALAASCAQPRRLSSADDCHAPCGKRGVGLRRTAYCIHSVVRLLCLSIVLYLLNVHATPAAIWVFLFCQINLWHCRQAFRMATSSCYGGVATAFQTVPGVSGFPVRPALCLRRIVAARQRTMQHAKRPGAIGGSPDCVPLAYSEKAGTLRAHWPAASGVWQPAFNAEVCLWMSP